MEPELSARVASLALLWNRTEGVLRHAEALSEKTALPTLHNLRHASRFWLEVLQLLVTRDYGRSNSRPDLEESLVVAESFIENARHDSIDAIIAHVSQCVRESDFTSPELLATIKELESLLVESRLDSSRREVSYAQMELKLDTLMQLFEAERRATSLMRAAEALRQTRNVALYSAAGSIFSIVIFSMAFAISIKGKLFDWLF